MAMSYTVETPVHVSAYWRFRLNRLEYVGQYWRSLPTRQVQNFVHLSRIKLSDKSSFFSLVTGGFLTKIIYCSHYVSYTASRIYEVFYFLL